MKILNDLNKVLYRSYSTCSNLKKKNKFTIRRGALDSAFKIISLFVKSKKYKSDVVFFTYGVNRIEKNGVSYNKFSDSISSLNPLLKYVNFEDSMIEKSCNQNCHIINLNISLVDFISRVVSRLFGASVGKRNIENYDGYVSIFYNKNKVQYLIYRNCFKFFLKITQPKVVFVSNWYGIRSMSIISAAHELGITTIDVQHGLSAANNHRCYVNLEGINEKLLPSYFFCWSERDAASLNIQLGEHRAVNVGRVWQLLPREDCTTFSIPVNKPVILLVCGLDLPAWFPQFTQLLQAKFSYLIRAHPTFGFSEKSVNLLADLDDIYIHDKGTLEDAFDHVDCCIGEWSAGLVEAQDNGILTMAFGEEACEYFDESNILTTNDFDVFVNYFKNIEHFKRSDDVGSENYEKVIKEFIYEKIK